LRVGLRVVEHRGGPAGLGGRKLVPGGPREAGGLRGGTARRCGGCEKKRQAQELPCAAQERFNENGRRWPQMNANGAVHDASQAKDSTSDLQARVAKVEQQAHPQASAAKIVNALGAMDLNHCLERLQRHEDRLRDQQVQRVVTDDLPAFCARRPWLPSLRTLRPPGPLR